MSSSTSGRGLTLQSGLRKVLRRPLVGAYAGCRLLGVGSSVPDTVLSNDDLAQLVETNDEWITTRTGIRSRRVLADGELIGDHSVASARNALEMAGVQAVELDMIILATSSPDDLFGSATHLQRELGATAAIAFDLTAACSGFVVALITAAQFIRTGARKRILVVGADALSRYIDWTDRGTCILFGDGAGAAVLTAHEGECAVLGSDMASDGAGYCHLNAPISRAAGGKALDATRRDATTAFDNIHMAGSDVFRFAVRAVPRTLELALADAGLLAADVDWLVMHQANQRILDAAAKKVGIPAARVVAHLAGLGNTSAASIPLALDAAVRDGRIRSGDVLALAGFGAGLTYASAIVRWR